MTNLKLKTFNIFLITIFFGVSFFLATESAEARRMGFGRSIGKPPPIKRQAIPPSQATKKAVDKTPSNASNATASKTRSGFMGPLAGLAAGFGLAALASYLGVGAELMGFLLILLAAGAIFFIVRMIMRNMQNKTSLDGIPSSLNKTNFEHIDDAKALAGGADLSSPKETISKEEINSFLENSKNQFIEIQKIWDSGNINKLKTFCTDEMVLELSEQITEKLNEGTSTSITELTAAWEGINSYVTDDGFKMEEVYVLFSGMIRENEDSLSNEFSEIWTLQRLKSSSDGWLIAGITQTN
jgi:predicted lipid-binding transport protein (Tim44 family)